MYEDNIYVKNYEAIKKLPGEMAYSSTSSTLPAISSTMTSRVHSTSTGAVCRPVCRSC